MIQYNNAETYEHDDKYYHLLNQKNNFKITMKLMKIHS